MKYEIFSKSGDDSDKNHGVISVLLELTLREFNRKVQSSVF